MFSVTSIVGVFLGGIVAYFLWKMLKTVLIGIGIVAVMAGALYWWAHTETPANPTLTHDEIRPPQGMVEHGARWLARPIHDVAQQVVELTQDETQFVKTVQESSTEMDHWLQKAEAVKTKIPAHLLKPVQGGLSQKAEPSQHDSP